MLVQILQTSHDLLQNLRGRDEEHGVLHIAGESRHIFRKLAAITGVIQYLSIRADLRQLSAFHFFDGGKDKVGDDIENVLRMPVFEMAPSHRLADFGLGEYLFQRFAGGVFKLLRLKLFFIQRTDEDEVSELLDDRQRVGDAARPNIRPYFVDLVFDYACDHDIPPYASQIGRRTQIDLFIIRQNDVFKKYKPVNSEKRKYRKQ